MNDKEYIEFLKQHIKDLKSVLEEYQEISKSYKKLYLSYAIEGSKRLNTQILKAMNSSFEAPKD